MLISWCQCHCYSELMSIGRNIIRMRKKRGLPREAMARKSGLSLSQTYRIEKELSLPSVKTLISIAKALGCSIDEIVGINSRSKSGPTKFK